MYECCVGPSARVVALDHDFAREQLSGLGTARARLMAADIHVEIWHAASSAAAFVLPESRADLVRVGIAAYGLWPSENIEGLTATAAPGVQLQPALTWWARGSQARRVETATGAPIRAGEVATLLGSDADALISAEQFAEWADTIHYEIIARIHLCVPRRMT